MSSLSAEREEHANRLAEDLASLVQQLGKMPSVEKVVLFGSYARGRSDLLTDLDLLVVMRSQLDFVSRTAELSRTLHARVGVDVLAYTPEEIDRLGSRPFFRHALTEGKVLYERRPGG